MNEPADDLAHDRALVSQAEEMAAVELARHVAGLTGELAAMARAHRLDLLAYFLEMARIEAQARARRPPAP